MTLFYAYIHNIRDDNTWRLVLVFASRSVSDQWWRAISSSPQAPFVQRIAPQFFTHDPTQANIYEFFTHPRFKPMSEQFRGRMFLSLIVDKGGRDFTIVPPQEITDYVSGNWFYIRSATNRDMYWYHNEDSDGDKLCVSHTKRTKFQVKARNLPDGTIMIGTDQITIHLARNLAVDVERSGALVAARVPREFTFDDLEKGNFAPEGNGILVYDVGSDSRKERWELV